jgi:hypothetical protein
VIPPSTSGGGGSGAFAALPAAVQAAFACIAGPNQRGSGESGGDPTAVNPSSGAGGLYQFLASTWLSNGGAQFAPTAEQASAADQDTVAAWTYASDGFWPWQGDNHCWEQYGYGP